MLQNGLEILWILNFFMGIAFQMAQILWDFISQCEIWHVWIFMTSYLFSFQATLMGANSFILE